MDGVREAANRKWNLQLIFDGILDILSVVRRDGDHFVGISPEVKLLA